MNMVGPVIIAFGNEAQKQHYLPRILACNDWWCQGYSEPGSGSDLASLKTRAENKGDHYIVNGQKTWTTLAQYADMMFCLVRTDTGVRKQEGISFLLIDMKTPGITVRPIITLDEDHEVNEVFFDNVHVPAQNLVGEENRGWTYAKYLLIPHIPGAGELLIFCGAMAGAGLAFLWFNAYPAQVFMGDVGALALGGALGTIAVIVRQEIVLFIMGGVFVVETLSVMLQVAYFKYTKMKTGVGKRVLLMAPLHHHYEQKGWKETQVVVRFWIITMMLVLFGLSTLKLR